MSDNLKLIIDVVVLILVAVFVPTITLLGYKMYKTKNTKTLLTILVLILLGLELVRFFYNATLYDAAKVPSSNLTFSFISFGAVISLFAVFANSKVGRFFRRINILTVLVPIILGAAFPHIINLPNDTYTVMKALYFVETGLYLAIAVVFVVLEKIKLNWISVAEASGFTLAYIGVNAMTIHFFETPIDYNLTYYLTMAFALLSVVIAFAYYVLYIKVSKEKTQVRAN